jgi:hypothetical protein
MADLIGEAAWHGVYGHNMRQKVSSGQVPCQKEWYSGGNTDTFSAKPSENSDGKKVEKRPTSKKQSQTENQYHE